MQPKSHLSNTLNRYSRQMILPQIGLKGQESLSSSRVLVIGAGGTGSTVLMYLASSGISATVLDFDTVEVSNLHRQIIHNDSNQNINKAISAVQRMQSINPTLDFSTITDKLTTSNASEIISQYDLVIDATDNFTARYIINDACCIHNVPLVSGSAVGLEGQVTVIVPRQTACYRCLYPKESFSESCRSCANAGVLGPVPGLVGCLLAIEATKLLLILGDKKRVESASSSGASAVPNKHVADLELLTGRQILYDGGAGAFHTFALPGRDPGCAVCGSHPTILSLQDTECELQQNQRDNEIAMCGFKVELSAANTVSPAEFYQRVKVIEGGDKTHIEPRLVLDVRSKVQFELSSFQYSELLNDSHRVVLHSSVSDCVQFLQTPSDTNSSVSLHVVSVPLETLKGGKFGSAEGKAINKAREIEGIQTIRSLLSQRSAESPSTDTVSTNTADLYVLCRRGVDSTVATQILLDSVHGVGSPSSGSGSGGGVFNIAGGLVAWKEQIEPSFPMY